MSSPQDLAKFSRTVMAAVLASSRDECDCKACIMLRDIADDLIKEFSKEAKPARK